MRLTTLVRNQASLIAGGNSRVTSRRVCLELARYINHAMVMKALQMTLLRCLVAPATGALAQASDARLEVLELRATGGAGFAQPLAPAHRQ